MGSAKPKPETLRGHSLHPKKIPTRHFEATSRPHSHLPDPNAASDRMHLRISPRVKQTHTLLDCQDEPAKTARKLLLDGHDGPTAWDSVTNQHLRRKELIQFMTTTGLIQVRHIIITEEDVRQAGYQLGEDI